MGKRVRAGKVSKQSHTHVRTIGKTEQRIVKRDELDIIGSICGTNRNQVGKVSNETSDYDKQNDDRTECAERERSASGSTTTADSDERESSSSHNIYTYICI